MTAQTTMEHKAFFGDADRTFKLTPVEIVELERKTGVGLGKLITRVLAREFAHADLTETIRLGLIGGGADPAEAAALVAAYAMPRPLSETYPLALAILMALWSGNTAAEKTATVAILDSKGTTDEPT